MDTSKDTAQSTGAADPAIDSAPPVGAIGSEPAGETAAAMAVAPTAEATVTAPPPPEAAAPPVAAPATERPVEAAATILPPSPPASPVRLPPAAVLPSTPVAAAPPRQAPPVEAPKPTESAPAPAARRPAPPRQEPPIVTAPPIATRAGGRKEGGASHSGRFALLAASMALAASLGGALGAGAFPFAAKLMTSTSLPAQQRTAAIDEIKLEIKTLRDSATQTRASVKALADNVAALKGAFESAGKVTGGQFAKVNEAIARLGENVERAERTQAEPAARLAKVIETLERLERRAAGMTGTAETTGSVAGQQAKPLGQLPQTLHQQQQQLQVQAAAPALPPAQTVAEAKPSAPTVVDGWVLHRVQGGIALIEGRYGLTEVEPGDTIRGIGRVQEIKRQDGRWVVVTARGLIVPAR